MTRRTASILPVAEPVSHNQVGQRLGRKGQETRERILAAMLSLLADRDGPPVTFTAVAKEANVRLTNLYLYFPDMGQMLLAALGRVMETAEEAYLDLLRPRWSDEALYESCLAFLRAHYAFWERNARLLHLRNALADAGDMRVLAYRHEVTAPIMDLLAAQMDCESGNRDTVRVATVFMTLLERVATVVTNPQFREMSTLDDAAQRSHAYGLLDAEAEVMSLAMAHRRRLAAQAARRAQTG